VSRWTKKYVIGLTGSIAAGKGAVRQMLQHLGAYAIDLDRLSQQAIQPGSPAYDPIVEAFGQDIVGDDGQIKRLALAGIITADPSALDRLDAITAPVIDQAVDAMVNHAAQSVIVIEASNLVNSALVKDLDTLWVVDARPEIQLQRLMENRNLSEDAAKQRIIAQGSSADLLQQADVVINNNGALEETWKQVQDAWAARDQVAQPAPEPASKPKAARERAPEKPQAPAPPKSSPLLDEIRDTGSRAGICP
jgi:dephospho-CoA kinase